MASGNQSKQRIERTTVHGLSRRTRWKSLRELASDGSVWGRGFICLVFVLIVFAINRGWQPAFSFHQGYIPQRDVVAATPFEIDDPIATQRARIQARSRSLNVYENDYTGFNEHALQFMQLVGVVNDAETFDVLDVETWSQLVTRNSASSDDETVTKQMQAVTIFDVIHSDEMMYTSLQESLLSVYDKISRNGVIDRLSHEPEDGSYERIQVYDQSGSFDQTQFRIPVDTVLASSVEKQIVEDVTLSLVSKGFPRSDAEIVTQALGNWISFNTLPTTLTINREMSRSNQESLVNSVETQLISYQPGDVIATGGDPIDYSEVELLRKEHDARVSQIGLPELLGISMANLGMYIALFAMSAAYLYVYEPRVVRHPWLMLRILLLLAVAVAAIRLVAQDSWRAQLVPVVMFAMILTIAFRRDVALLLSMTLALIVSVSMGNGLPEFIIMVAAIAPSTLLLGHIRNRTRLTQVGLTAGVITMLTTIGMGILTQQTPGVSANEYWNSLLNLDTWNLTGYVIALLRGAVWYGFCVLLAGFFTTGLLPLVEWTFKVSTDISLKELGDPKHPLLKELAERAPGTYSHSLQVASLAEQAAEAIGANGLLVRVGAYFHDIGKMFKPEYFAENQTGATGDLHQRLLPAMSRLVIIAHVKDGIELAREHHLPTALIDFIEQHHGTTLVEYFYHQAKSASDADPDNNDVDESEYRYPGRKPQSREAAVMMMADAVESATRALDEPAPARIESLVRDIAMSRLLDGEFDESGLTLTELSVIQVNLTGSLQAVMHNRPKYPSKDEADEASEDSSKQASSKQESSKQESA